MYPKEQSQLLEKHVTYASRWLTLGVEIRRSATTRHQH